MLLIVANLTLGLILTKICSLTPSLRLAKRTKVSLREAFQKKSVDFFQTGPNPHFYKILEKRVFLALCGHFCQFLTLLGKGGGVFQSL